MPNNHSSNHATSTPRLTSFDLPSGLRIIKWLFLAWLYLSIASTCLWISYRLFIVFLIIFASVIIFSTYAYSEDQNREKRSHDKLRGHNLFFRYGDEVDRTAINLPVKQEWTVEEIASYVSRFETAVAKNLEHRLLPDKAQATDAHTVWFEVAIEPFLRVESPARQSVKSFLKLTLKTSRGHQVSHFAHVSLVGRLVVVHFYFMARGRYAWHDTFDFILISPLTWIFWTIRWLLNEFSVIAYLGRRPIENSFDAIDVDAVFSTAITIITEEIGRFLKEEGFTAEAASLVINRIKNLQNVNISNQGKLKVGNIVNKLSNVVPGLGN